MCTGLGCARVRRAYERTHARHGVLRVYGEVINAQLLQGELLRALVSDLGEDGVRQREILGRVTLTSPATRERAREKRPRSSNPHLEVPIPTLPMHIAYPRHEGKSVPSNRTSRAERGVIRA